MPRCCPLRLGSAITICAQGVSCPHPAAYFTRVRGRCETDPALRGSRHDALGPAVRRKLRRVARQYSSTVGRVDTCHVAVSVHAASDRRRRAIQDTPNIGRAPTLPLPEFIIGVETHKQIHLAHRCIDLRRHHGSNLVHIAALAR